MYLLFVNKNLSLFVYLLNVDLIINYILWIGGCGGWVGGWVGESGGSGWCGWCGWYGWCGWCGCRGVHDFIKVVT